MHTENRDDAQRYEWGRKKASSAFRPQNTNFALLLRNHTIPPLSLSMSSIGPMSSCKQYRQTDKSNNATKTTHDSLRIDTLIKPHWKGWLFHSPSHWGALSKHGYYFYSSLGQQFMNPLNMWSPLNRQIYVYFPLPDSQLMIKSHRSPNAQKYWWVMRVKVSRHPTDKRVYRPTLNTDLH